MPTEVNVRELVPFRGRKIAIDDVKPVSDALWKHSLAQSFLWRVQKDVKMVSEPDKPVINLSDNRGTHQLISAIHTAFAAHRPLALTPDSIWLVLAQGFSHHIRANAETFRGRLVRHEGKRTLRGDMMDLGLGQWRSAIDQISRQIREESDPVLHETLLCDFSTTTEPIRVASEVVLMDAYADYFDYSFECICGIPYVRFGGTLEDWRRIRGRFEVLATYDLEWWAPRVRPILDEFVRTAEGHPSPEFWKAIYKPKEAYEAPIVTGWIADLFPYLGDVPLRKRNKIFEYPRIGWSVTADQGIPTSRPLGPQSDKGFPAGQKLADAFSAAKRSIAYKFHQAGALRWRRPSNTFEFDDPSTDSATTDQGIPTSGPLDRGSQIGSTGFPCGLASVPVKLNESDLELLAGFLAVEQLPDDGALAPVIGWAAVDPASSADYEREISGRYNYRKPPPLGTKASLFEL